MSLHQRMLEAATTLEEVSVLYGYLCPETAPWSASGLRAEADHVAADTPALYDVNCSGALAEMGAVWPFDSGAPE